VVGGESPTLAAGILPGNSEIFYGSGTTESTYIAPTATIAAWSSFIATAAPSGDIVVRYQGDQLGPSDRSPHCCSTIHIDCHFLDLAITMYIYCGVRISHSIIFTIRKLIVGRSDSVLKLNLRDGYRTATQQVTSCWPYIHCSYMRITRKWGNACRRHLKSFYASVISRNRRTVL
jgi:hypothetical protein